MTSTPGGAFPIQHRVSAILVSHNGARWLPEVVAALSSQERPPDFLLAVDTGSKDGSVDLLRNSRINVLEIAAHAGFGEAVAHGVAQLPQPHQVINEHGEIEEREVEWIWLLHDDCAPAPETLATLLAAVSERPNVGVVGPKILAWHDRTHLLEVGVTIAHNGARWTGLERNERDQGQHDGDGFLQVLAVSTAGALIRRDLFEEIGGFDENLPLFRDDVDFGMRAYMAGFIVMCATNARLFHAEAAATERRVIDVAGGAFHRPHILDRRHAAFVLLANLPLWTLPWITARIFFSALIRSLGYLLAKLPGYALDELLAVALLFTRLDRLRVARRARRKKRLLPARVVRPLLAPWSEQIKLGVLKIRDILLRRADRTPEPVVGNIFAESDEADEGELLAPEQRGFWRRVVTRPLFVAIVPLVLFSFIAGRSRFGALAGGALSKSGDSAFGYLQIYSQSWHAIGIGSGSAVHPFTALLAFLSVVLGGNPAIALSVLFMAAPLLALLSMYRCVRSMRGGRWVSIISALLFASSTTLLLSVDAGYASTVLLMIFLPLCVLVLPPIFIHQARALTWRRSCIIALLLTILSTLSFQIYIAALIFFIVHLFTLRANRTLLLERLVKYGIISAASFLALAPWSLSKVMHPVDLFADQGVALPFASSLHVLLGNLQPLDHAPIYVLSCALLIGIIALFSKTAYLDSLAIFSALFLAAFTSAFNVKISGSALEGRIWPGGFLALSIFFTSRALASLSEGRLTRLRTSPVGRGHFLSVFVSCVVAYCICANLFWWTSAADSSPVTSSKSSVLPPFISAATENSDRPKTLILRSETVDGVNRFSYVVLRERDVILPELTALPDENVVLATTVSEITAGGGDAPSALLAQFGIRYLYLQNGDANKSLARKIDGVGGLTRLSATSDGILWEVSGLTSRIRFIGDASGSEEIELPSEKVGGEFDVPTSGVVSLAELFDSRWRALHDGKVLLPRKSEIGLTQFVIPGPGRVVLFHDGTIQRAGISLQLAILGLLLFFALPRGRRQAELRDEEVS